LPHVEPLQIGQQTEFGRKRLELVLADLKHRGFGSDQDQGRFVRRTESISSAIMCAISLGSEQSLLLVSESVFTFVMRNNLDGTSIRPMSSS
jgi:hypothetical protein